MTNTRLSGDGRTLTVRVPMAFSKRGGRKSVISPDGVSTVMSSRPQIDSALVKALARAFRWRKLLETGIYATIVRRQIIWDRWGCKLMEGWPHLVG